MTPEVVNAPLITTIDMAEIIRMPEGYQFKSVDNDGKFYDCSILEDKMYYSPTNYTQL